MDLYYDLNTKIKSQNNTIHILKNKTIATSQLLNLNSKLLFWTYFLFLKGAGSKLRPPSQSPASFWSRRRIFSNKSGFLHHRDKSNSKGFTLHLWVEVWSIFRIFCYFSCLRRNFLTVTTTDLIWARLLKSVNYPFKSASPHATNYFYCHF